MTLGTGRRISRACLRCRRRKTKCNLDGIGEPKKPPCESCHRSNSECILVQSRRGASGWSNRRHKTLPAAAMTPDTGPDHPTESHSTGFTNDPTATAAATTNANFAAPSNCRPESDAVSEAPEGDDDEDDLRMELRNPSDALQILSQARDSPGGSKPSQQQWPSPEARSEAVSASQTRSALGSNVSMYFGNRAVAGQDTTTPTTLLDDYELVQRGLLHPSVVPELLHIFARHCHAYCPIVPAYMLGPQSMSQIQRPDYFLLTVILVIASRDSPRHLLTHRYCWDHTERLLLEVLLAHRWAQAPRTVQALLLLAEWLPYRSKQEEASTPSMSLLMDDQSAWSMIGLAVRQAYLLRLDRAAFPNTDDRDPHNKEEEEEKRLIWTFIYLADRQISVRMGQSFWSRGPSLSSTLTARDFPHLKPLPGSEGGDFALVLQAQLELTQILYNAHGILYSSANRTLAMVNDGDYARYLDDFQRSALAWHASWRDIQVPQSIRATLFLLFEYVCLYVNAFSFQAVLTRATGKNGRASAKSNTGARLRASLFSRGLMTSPDGPYIYEAVSSARKILAIFEEQSPQDTLRYLPTRYYLYGVYAAVFLHKAQRARVFQSPDQERETFLAARQFILKLEEISTDELHLCHRYSAMLSRIWQRRGTPHRATGTDSAREPGYTASAQNPASIVENADIMTNAGSTEPQTQWSHHQSQDFDRFPDNPHHTHSDWTHGHGAAGLTSPPDTIQRGNEEMMPPDVEDYFFGPFFPGVMDVDFDGEFGAEFPLQ